MFVITFVKTMENEAIFTGKKRQRIAEECLDDQNDVDGGLEALCGQVVGDLFLGVQAPRQEADVGEESLENGGGQMAPVQHFVEALRLGHVPFQCRQKDLRCITVMLHRSHFISEASMFR